jgi:hypothetical protein
MRRSYYELPGLFMAERSKAYLEEGVSVTGYLHFGSG